MARYWFTSTRHRPGSGNVMTNGLRDYLILCKPRVVLLMLLTTWAGMYLATDQTIPLSLWITATVGVALMSGSAATLNHAIDYQLDALMERTKNRPLATGKISRRNAFIFATIQGLIGFIVLYFCVNPLTAWLTFLAGVGYAGIYSLYLKKATSQNIVIGGLSGAMPPLLGWTAVSNELTPQGWLLVLIIFTWTPAHFWALCLHRYEEYKAAAIPMLPITHGIAFTKLNIVFYSLLTVACSLMPYAIGMSGLFYLISVTLLNIGMMFYTLKLQFASHPSPLALKTFRYSLFYLTGLFIALLIDHHFLIN